MALVLEPQPGTDTHGRGGFLIHGDMVDPAQRGQASHGCIIVPRLVRLAVLALVSHYGDSDLLVVE